MNEDTQNIRKDIKLKFAPKKRAFLTMRIIPGVLSFFIFSITAIVAAFLVHALIALALIPLLAVLIYHIFDTLTAYKKQRYEFTENIAYYGDGNLFTDRNTELRFPNVTHVRVVKPFIEYHIFGTGKILIDSAGSKQAAVELKSIEKPYEAFEKIRELLRARAFSLTYDELKVEKKPAPLAVILQLLGGIIAAGFFLSTTVSVGTIVALVTNASSLLILLGVVIIALIFFAYFYVSYQDQRRRTYSVYSDVIHYSKGYLTKQEAFIPAENLANTELSQNFIGKLLNLQDIVVSCQAQGAEIRFSNLQNGEDMQSEITALVGAREAGAFASTESEATRTSAAESGQNTGKVSQRFTAPPTPQTLDPSAQDFQMDIKRAIVSALPLIIIPPVFVIAAIAQYIIAGRTVYRLTDGGVSSYFSFLSTKNVEFSREKITGLVIKRNPFDRWCGTCTITFWSIGSGQSIDFKFIPENEGLVSLMKQKAGIVEDEELETIRPQFSLSALFKSSIFSAIIDFTLLIVLVVLALTVSPWFYLAFIAVVIIDIVYIFVLYRRYREAFLRLGQHTVQTSIGVLFHAEHFAKYDNVKNVTLTKYPHSELGTIRFDIAGEHTFGAGSSPTGGTQTLPNHFTLAFLPRVAPSVRGESIWLDQTLLHKPNGDEYEEFKKKHMTEAKHTSGPELKNSLLTLIPLHVILFPLLILLPLSIYLRAYWLRRVSYRLEEDRVVKRSGVIYKKQTSILLSRLDYAETGQNFANKLCKNGNIYLYTAGSSSAELILRDMPDYQEFAHVLKGYTE